MKRKRFFCFILSILLVITILPTTAFAVRPTKTQEDALNWARAQVGRVLGSGQCVHLIMDYYRFLGRSPSVINGCDYAKSDALRFGWSQLYQAQPQPGDILVYEGGPLNPYGHVAIYESDYVHYHQNVIGETGVVRGTWHYKDCDPDYTSYWGVVRPAWPSASDPPEDEYGYRITLDANGGTVSPDHIFADHTYGENGDLPIPTRPGYSFYKWGIDKTVTYETISWGSTVSSANVITRTYDHTLYAVWQPLRYTISLDASGGTVSPSSKTIYSGDTYGALPPAARNGYIFLGWFTSSSGGSQVTSDDTYSAAGNQVLYAHWEQVAISHIHSLRHIMAKAATQTEEGNIEYWYCSECGKYYSDSAASAEIARAQTVLSKLSATTAKTHTIKFDAGEGTVSEAQRTVPVGEDIGELPIPTRTGYRFLGWYILPTTASAKVTSDTPVNRVNLPDGCTLYACWTEAEGKLTVSPSRLDFDGLQEGYSQPDAKMVTVKNTGDGEVTLSNPTASNFELGTLSSTKLTANASATFTVRPKTGLHAGTYSETITVKSSDSKISAAVSVSFTVEAETPAASDSNFTDISAQAYYYTPVLWAVEQGITSGTSATMFSPDVSCTRGQIVTFLWRAAGSPRPTSNTNPFTDVKKGAYYHDAVLWAVEKKITGGTSSTTFSPYAACTRGQTVTFLWRAAGSPRAASNTNPFSDVKTGSYYYDAVLWAVEKKITSGTSVTTFSPASTVTRGQTVTFLYRSQGK